MQPSTWKSFLFPTAAWVPPGEQQVPRYTDRWRDPLRFGMTGVFRNAQIFGGQRRRAKLARPDESVRAYVGLIYSP